METLRSRHIDLVELELDFSAKGERRHIFSSENIKWKLEEKNYNSWYLTMLSGAASAEIFSCICSNPTNHSCASILGPAKITEGEEINFRGGHPIKFVLKLCILQLTPYFEACQQSTLFADLSFYNDVKLYFGPKKELILASKFMLSVRSPIFKAMFKSGVKEAKSNEVEIKDISATVGKEMIKYIYTDHANVGKMVEELYFAAEKYQISGLKTLCENGLVGALDTSNAAHYLLFVNRYCDDRVKKQVLLFITKDKDTCSQVMQSAQWKDVLEIPDLAFAVINKYFDVPAKPDTVIVLDAAEPDSKRIKVV